MKQHRDSRWQAWRGTGQASAGVFRRWGRHEWRSLQGHRLELAERLRLMRSARGFREIIHDQLDLLPESRRRLQRDAEIRRALLRELRQALQSS